MSRSNESLLSASLPAPHTILSPDRLASSMSLEADEVRGQLRSIEGRKTLINQLRGNPQAVAALEKGGYSMDALERDLDAASMDLAAEQRFLEAQARPEKKGLFRTAWDTITWLPRKHPIITVALLGVVLGAVASYMGWIPRIDFPGLWGRAQGLLGWGNTSVESAAESAAEGAAAIGKEVPAGSLELIPETLRIRIFDHNFIYGDKIYGMDELPELLEKLPAVPEGEFIRLLPYGNSRVTAEMAIRQALEDKGIQSAIFEKLIDTEFVPAAP